MWPLRPRRPRLVKSAYTAYLRGRMVGAGIGEVDEAALYADEAAPLPLRVAFAVGVTSRRRAPIMTAREVEQAVATRIDLAAIVQRVEGGGDYPGTGNPPAAAPPAVPVEAVPVEAVRVKETQRLPVHAIGDPVPATGS